MAGTEDAATVLEQFVHDVANLPAEVAHLLEEIQAKDQIIQECRQVISNRDSGLQKHIKQMGVHVKHAKEEQMEKLVLSNYEKAQALQDDKVALIQKATFLLDRQVKRLDLKMQDLVNEGALAVDVLTPSLLHDSPANLVPPASVTSTGVNTPLSTLTYSAGSSTNVANAAIARMASTSAQSNRIAAHIPIAGMQPHSLLNASVLGQRQREMSAGAIADSKRRRLNTTIPPIPIPSSKLGRQSSLGPGTPKSGTPISRAGSLGPRPKKALKKPPTHQQHSMRKKTGKGGLSKKSTRRLLGGTRASPSTTGEDNSEESGSEEDIESSAPGHDGAADEEEVEEGGGDEEGDDTTPYCTCRQISHGNMVACDNVNCAYEWFHWACVGLTSEPKGKWICPECRKLPASKVKLGK